MGDLKEVEKAEESRVPTSDGGGPPSRHHVSYKFNTRLIVKVQGKMKLSRTMRKSFTIGKRLIRERRKNSNTKAKCSLKKFLRLIIQDWKKLYRENNLSNK